MQALEELPYEEATAAAASANDDAPAHRVATLGAAALSSRELLALVIGSDLDHVGAAADLHDLAAAGSVAEVQSRYHLSEPSAARVMAALELGARVAGTPPTPRPPLRDPSEAARYLLPRYAARPVEAFGILVLDVRHRLKREVVVSTGSLTASLVHPREVFHEAIVSRAAAIVLFHNHPSGDPEPSPEDIALTRRLVAAGTLMGIEVLDHLILGAGRFVSLKERGFLCLTVDGLEKAGG